MSQDWRRALLMTSALVPLTLAAATAGPNGATVVGGSATVQGQGTANVVVNQTSQSAVVNWNTFNIGAGETTRINMPSPSSVELDRVTGGLGPSQILGSLSSNGRVFLVNPDGILFGAGSRVNVGGLLATTHDISNADFMAGRYNFSISGNPSASIVNQGSITAQTGGFAALVAPGVRNTGTITATLGTIALASGNAFTLDLYGDQLIKLGVNDSIASQVIDVSTGKPLSSLVSNEGTLKANGGRVELTAVAARKVVDSVIRNTGVIEANTIGSHNGMIVLGAATRATRPSGAPTQTVKVSGTLSAAGNANGTSGGTIVVTGEDIQVNNTNINVSGSTGGGALLIGGDWGGGHPNTSLVSNPSANLEPYAIPTASTVSIDPTTTINASATITGNGGKVVVWSDDLTKAYGSILATGGVTGGNGGFVETSGGAVNFSGAHVDTSAPAGKIGTWLVDPTDLTVEAATAATINADLATTSVTLQSTASGTSGPGDLIVASPLFWSSSSTLTLDAYNGIVVNSPITVGGPGALVLEASNNPLAPAVPLISFNNGASIQFTGTPHSGQSLTVNSQAYTLLYSMSDVQNINSGLSGHYALAVPLDATGVSWTPLGTNGSGTILNSGNGFGGAFEGLGNSISNLAVNLPSAFSVGLFGYVGTTGTIQNVQLIGQSVTGNTAVGGLVGFNGGTVAQSYAAGHVHGTGGDDVGELVGFNAGTVAMSYATGSVSGPLDVGGLIGDNRGTVIQSYASTTVTGTNTSFDFGVGGLVGYMFGGTITQSYATGPVSAPSYVGGLVGFTWNGTIAQSYSIGAVSGTSNFGGLIGYNNGGNVVTASYWDTLTSGISSSTTGGTPIDDTTLKNNLPTGFSSAVWGVNGGYPFLLWQKISNNSASSSATPGLPPAQNQFAGSTLPDYTGSASVLSQIDKEWENQRGANEYLVTFPGTGVDTAFTAYFEKFSTSIYVHGGGPTVGHGVDFSTFKFTQQQLSDIISNAIASGQYPSNGLTAAQWVALIWPYTSSNANSAFVKSHPLDFATEPGGLVVLQAIEQATFKFELNFASNWWQKFESTSFSQLPPAMQTLLFDITYKNGSVPVNLENALAAHDWSTALQLLTTVKAPADRLKGWDQLIQSLETSTPTAAGE